MQFIKHVEPRFSKPRRPIVVIAFPCTTYRRRGYCNNASMLLLVVIHGLHDTILFKFLRDRKMQKMQMRKRTNFYSTKKKKKIAFTWPLFVNVSVPLHSNRDRKRNLGTHDNKSYHSLILVRYYVVSFPNDQLCAVLCIRKIYNANMNKAVAQSCRMCSIGTISPKLM